jgi:hypothetical protein
MGGLRQGVNDKLRGTAVLGAERVSEVQSIARLFAQEGALVFVMRLNLVD